MMGLFIIPDKVDLAVTSAGFPIGAEKCSWFRLTVFPADAEKTKELIDLQSNKRGGQASWQTNLN